MLMLQFQFYLKVVVPVVPHRKAITNLISFNLTSASQKVTCVQLSDCVYISYCLFNKKAKYFLIDIILTPKKSNIGFCRKILLTILFGTEKEDTAQLHLLYILCQKLYTQFSRKQAQMPKRSFSMTENERFGLVFANTGSINSATVQLRALCPVF